MPLTSTDRTQITASTSTETPHLSPSEPAEFQPEQALRFRQWRARWEKAPRGFRDHLKALEGLLDELDDALRAASDREL